MLQDPRPRQITEMKVARPWRPSSGWISPDMMISENIALQTYYKEPSPARMVSLNYLNITSYAKKLMEEFDVR